MKLFVINYSTQAKKFLKKTNKNIAKRILETIEELGEKPFRQDTKRVEGFKEKIFRIRIGEYRVLYEVDHKQRIIGIIKIDKRANIY